MPSFLAPLHLVPIPSLPAAGTAGRLVVLSSNNRAYLDNGAAWIDLTSPRMVSGTVCNMDPFVVTGSVHQAHGLGAAPTMLVGKLICKTADLGYAVGDAIMLPPVSINYSGSGGGSRGMTVGADSTEVFIHTPADPTQLTRKDTNAIAAITAVRWRIEVTPWLIVL